MRSYRRFSAHHLGIRVLDAIAADHQFVVHADHEQNDQDEHAADDENGDQASGHRQIGLNHCNHDGISHTWLDSHTVTKSRDPRMTNSDDNQHDSAPLDAQTEKEHAGFFDRIRMHKNKAKQGFQTLKEHLAEESDETKNMVDTYQRWVEGKPQDEMKVANEQFKDLIRLAGVGTFFSWFESMLLLPIAVYGANKVGIRLLPGRFMPDEHPDQGEG